jgi:hypothetical protein
MQAADPAAVPAVQLPCLELLTANDVLARATNLALRQM